MKQFSRRKFIALSTLPFLASCCAGIRGYPESRLEVWFLDVGYGNAALIRMGDCAVMIDGGYSVCSDRLSKTLTILNISRLTAAIVTHPHPDHIGGIHGLMESGLPIGCIYGAYPLEDPTNPRGFQQAVKAREIPYRTARRGDTINRCAEIKFNVINPEGLTPNMNNSSLVLKLGEPGQGILFTADIEFPPQKEIAEEYGDRLRSQIMTAPHHGGELDPDFLRIVSPEEVVAQVGINPYGNPSADVVKLLRDKQIPFQRTDQTGTLRYIRNNRGKFQKADVPRGT